MKYSKTTGGFYDSSINTNIPNDAVEISPDLHAQLLQAQASGKVIKANLQGHPIAVDAVGASESDLRIANLNALWQAATDYETSFISGSAVKYLSNGKPKSKLVSEWVDSIWALYYKRQLLVTSSYDVSLSDFSICGKMPFSIPELQVEASIK